MRNKKYHTVATVPKSNWKVTEMEAKFIRILYHNRNWTL